MKSWIFCFIILTFAVLIAGCGFEDQKQQNLQSDKEQLALENFHVDREGVSLFCERKDFNHSIKCWIENHNEFDVRIKSIRQSGTEQYGHSEITTDIYRLPSHQKTDCVNPREKFYVYNLDGVELGFLNAL